MGETDPSAAKGCAVLALILLAVPLVVVGIVGVRTWTPLQRARSTLEELERSLGPEAEYVPNAGGVIPSERMEVFLDLRSQLMGICDQYGAVQGGFDSVASLDSTNTVEAGEVADVARLLGGAAFEITPFLARFFEHRNRALLAASMGLDEYRYIYALAYRDRLLSGATRREIFSDGDALSAEASAFLMGCLARQLEALDPSDSQAPLREGLEAELARMEADPLRLPWQDGLPDAVVRGLAPYRELLDTVFCPATAGLEMESGPGRALRVALE